MPRPLRVQVAGGMYHVTSRGNRRQAIFHDDDDRRQFVAFRDRAVHRYGWRIHAYCLMTNHFHLLVETPNPNLSACSGSEASTPCTSTNASPSLAIFQQRFGSSLIEGDEYYYEEALRYIAFNPVKAGLCAHSRRLAPGATSSAGRTSASTGKGSGGAMSGV